MHERSKRRGCCVPNEGATAAAACLSAPNRAASFTHLKDALRPRAGPNTRIVSENAATPERCCVLLEVHLVPLTKGQDETWPTT